MDISLIHTEHGTINIDFTVGQSSASRPKKISDSLYIKLHFCVQEPPWLIPTTIATTTTPGPPKRKTYTTIPGRLDFISSVAVSYYLVFNVLRQVDKAPMNEAFGLFGTLHLSEGFIGNIFPKKIQENGPLN